MARTAASRPLWVSGGVVLVSLWFLVQSSSLSNRTTPATELSRQGTQNIEIHPEDVNDIRIDAEIFHPGDTIPASAWEHGTPALFKGAPENSLYEAEKNKPKKPSEEPPRPMKDCPVCPDQADHAELGKMPLIPSPEHATPKATKEEDRPLILYAYHESDFGRQNLQFFVDHGLHAAADFVFIINGPSDAEETIIFKDSSRGVPTNDERRNVKVKKRDNTCFDLGAHAEVLNGVIGGPGWSDFSGPIVSPDNLPAEGQEVKRKGPLKDRYNRYILMNASVRGPFVPLWSKSCWSDAYLDKVTEKIKMVGMSYNCHTDRGHVQSMIWATDSVGLSVILTPEGIDECFANMPAAQNGEIRTTQLLRDRGYEVDVFLSVYHSKDAEIKQGLLEGPGTDMKEKESDWGIQEKETASDTDVGAEEAEEEKEEDSPTSTDVGAEEAEEEKEEDSPTNAKREIEVSEPGVKPDLLSIPGDFWKSCTDEDWLGPGSYFGTFVHPYENLFMKSHRHIEDIVLDRLTEWHNGWGYSSYDVCF